MQRFKPVALEKKDSDDKERDPQGDLQCSLESRHAVVPFVQGTVRRVIDLSFGGSGLAALNRRHGQAFCTELLVVELSLLEWAAPDLC